MVAMQTLRLSPGTGALTLSDNSPADKSVAIMPTAITIKEVLYSHGTAGSDGGAVTLQLKRLKGTDAPSAGDALLSAGFNCKGTANTVQVGALTGTTANLTLAKGDRLGFDYTGTLTALANVVVTVIYNEA
jgi:hypothetical protein